MSHSSIDSFKQFIKKHPGLIKEVRNGKRTWKQLYEEWYIVGEDDETWKTYKKTNKKETPQSKEWLANALNMLNDVDFNEVQKNIGQLNGLLERIQHVVREFQTKSTPPTPPRDPHDPFYFR